MVPQCWKPCLNKVVGIKAKSDWLIKFQLKKSAKKDKHFQLFVPPTFYNLFSDIVHSCLNCACTVENLGKVFNVLEFFS